MKKSLLCYLCCLFVLLCYSDLVPCSDGSGIDEEVPSCERSRSLPLSLSLSLGDVCKEHPEQRINYSLGMVCRHCLMEDADRTEAVIHNKDNRNNKNGNNNRDNSNNDHLNDASAVVNSGLRSAFKKVEEIISHNPSQEDEERSLSASGVIFGSVEMLLGDC